MLDMMDKCELLDMEAMGLKFTLYQKQVGKVVAKRIDRVLVDQPWHIVLLEVFVENLCQVYSNHYPMLLRCGGMRDIRGERPFRFHAAWVAHNQYDFVVHFAWAKGSPSVTGRLKQVQDNSLVFNQNVFGNIFHRKRQVQSRLKGV